MSAFTWNPITGCCETFWVFHPYDVPLVQDYWLKNLNPKLWEMHGGTWAPLNNDDLQKFIARTNDMPFYLAAQNMRNLGFIVYFSLC